MGRLIVISVLFFTAALPLRVAREPSPMRGLRKLLLYLCLADAAYLFALFFLMPRLF